MSRRFAHDTDVPADRSRAHLEQLLRAHGCEGFAYGWSQTYDRIEFLFHQRQIRFVLPRPKRDDVALSPAGNQRAPRAIDAALEAENRRRWRALLLVVRAKIEAVESNIASFEQEFLAFIVLPNDQTVGDILVPQLEDGSIARRLLPPGQRQPQ